MIAWGYTTRGFRIGEFEDRYNQKCSIQDSSLAEDDAIWLGVEDALWDAAYDAQPVYIKIGSHFKHINARMHLTREMVVELLPALQYFAETGLLPDNGK